MYDIIPNPSHGLCPAARCTVLLSTAGLGGGGGRCFWLGQVTFWTFLCVPWAHQDHPCSPSCTVLLQHCPGWGWGGGAVTRLGPGPRVWTFLCVPGPIRTSPVPRPPGACCLGCLCCSLPWREEVGAMWGAHGWRLQGEVACPQAAQAAE